MDFKKTFCTSPWIHQRIAHNGNFQFCRWQKTAEPPYDFSQNIDHKTPQQYWDSNMREIRRKLLDGEVLDECSDCHHMEEHGMVSGRQKQLLKCGITLDKFEQTMKSSPVYDNLKYSQNNEGDTKLKPIDWHIDTGNYCNGGCIMCSPYWSSSLAKEFMNNGLAQEMPRKSWADTPEYVDRMVEQLEATDHLHYIHFLGGETLITPAFKTILQRLVKAKISPRVTVGFTTNLMMWDHKIIKLLTEFNTVHVNCSIDCMHEFNDYQRYPAKLYKVMTTLNNWRVIARRHSWQLQIRPTVTNLSAWHLDTVYEYCFKNKLTVESCNFLEKPMHFRISTLPTHFREKITTKLEAFLDKCPKDEQTVINIRNPDTVEHQIVNDCKSYLAYLKNEPDRSELLPKLTEYLMTLEKNSDRGSVLTYLPDYEELLRTNGYKPHIK